MNATVLLVTVLTALALSACGRPPEPTVNLYRAVQVGDLDQIKRHFAWGTDPNQIDPNGDMPLHVAARDGKVGIVREFAEHGAELNAPNAAGETPIYLALLNGKTQVADALVKAGARLEPQAMLMDLILAGVSDRDTVDFLIRRGADVNRPDENGQAPLHLAVSSGHLESIRRLLQRGADVNRPDGTGATPLALAQTLNPRAPDTADIMDTLHRLGARLPYDVAPNTPFNPTVDSTTEPK